MANVLINNVLDGRRACFVGVVPSGPNSGSVFLVSDAGVTGSPDSALSIRGSGIASNSQCSINAAGSSASWTGGSLILTFAITFSEAFGGNKVVFLASQDKSPASTGWQALGTWGVPGSATVGPGVGGVRPARSNTRSQIYTFTFTDTQGGGGIAVANILINRALDSRRGCYLAFVPSGTAAGTVLLVDDAGDTGGPYRNMTVPGSAGIANSQCSVAAAGSSASVSGNALTLTLALTFTFTEAFAGN